MNTNKIIQFLSELNNNNNREWFDENRKVYESCRDEFKNFTQEVINSLSAIDSDIIGLQPKNCIFRIFRDVRFSKNKLPYKTNFGAFFAKGGRKGINPGYYIHIEPNNCFLGGGVYMPQGNVLKALRQEIYYNTDSFKAIINDKTFKSEFPELYQDKLKTTPRDFPKDYKDIELLRYKSYIVSKHVKADELTLDNIIDTFKIILPFNKYLSDGLYEINQG